MTAATMDRDDGRVDGELIQHGLAADAVVYKGTMVMFDTLGYLTPMTDASGNVFAGVAYEAGDATGDSSGNVKVRVQRKGAFEMVLSGAAITVIGDEVYASDDQTVKTTQGTSTAVGVACKYENSGKIYIDIGGYC